jgi:poly(3-hydroxybutyrate) depolymerase
MSSNFMRKAIVAPACVLALCFAAINPALAQRGPMTMTPDPRTEQRSYHFEDTNEDLGYVLFVSSKVRPGSEAPLIVALHGLGGDANFLVRDGLIDLAEEKGYIVVGPLGYNVGGWYGSPVIVMNGRGRGRGAAPDTAPAQGAEAPAPTGPSPEDLQKWSEQDVMNVLAMMREEFNIDDERTYLIGHSMGGAGALFLGQKHVSEWAALAAIAPAAFMMESYRAEILAPIKAAGVPLMIIQGDMDPAVPVENTRRWAETMREMGLKQEYIELAGGDHGTVIWDGMPEIFRFFEEHSR